MDQTANQPFAIAQQAPERLHRGSCHCGAVQFEVLLDLRSGPASRCNCSICTKLNGTTGIGGPDAITVKAGEDNLSSYEWGGRTARRYFCKTCGVHCFLRGSLPELGGDYVSINLNALDDIDVDELKVVHWDGRHNNWHAGPRSTPWPRFTTVPVQ